MFLKNIYCISHISTDICRRDRLRTDKRMACEEEFYNCTDPNNLMIFSDAAKNFMWPDNAVYLLLELYQEKEEMFNTSFKKHNILWKEIAASMRETSNIYNVTGQQCSNKLSGLKRTYRNIIDQNKKSGNGRNSWEFYSVISNFSIIQKQRKYNKIVCLF